jgi:hypothetical protein
MNEPSACLSGNKLFTQSLDALFGSNEVVMGESIVSMPGLASMQDNF